MSAFLKAIRRALVNAVGLATLVEQSEGELGPDEDFLLDAAQEVRRECTDAVDRIDNPDN